MACQSCRPDQLAFAEDTPDMLSFRCVSGQQIGNPSGPASNSRTDSAEVRRLKAELRRVTEERDILKKAAAYFARG